ncbi:putative cytochrome b5 1 [Leptomonas seymouri]|uniref:Putative cytochrome b5 1 n=1 Tax=Leptomonas seymouri TaxID=5684 RepID=A0A0N1PFL2_LEPSE|nr:putative cytochrome b5 1 [Leptomonas seymouri]|eukprot:KPI89004.1 putative cytochrome b5 1 [Leptomonas seymouri]
MSTEYTLEEVARHNTPRDFWTVIDGEVYHFDVEFVTTMHPGGLYILEAAGKDGSKLFHEHHNAERLRDMMRDYHIGKVKQ